jgi:hypothetical protein
MPCETVKKIDGIDAWEVRNAANDLIRAKEIEADPKLYKAALKIVDKKMKATAEAKLDAIKKVVSKKKDPVNQPTVTIQA